MTFLTLRLTGSGPRAACLSLLSTTQYMAPTKPRATRAPRPMKP